MGQFSITKLDQIILQ